VRFLQNILLVLGASVLGAVSCGLGLPYLAALALFRPRHGEDPSLAWGPAFVAVPFIVCGGTFGAVAGAVGAVRWISRRGDVP
jgi:hypothetical protein